MIHSEARAPVGDHGLQARVRILEVQVQMLWTKVRERWVEARGR